MAEKQEFSVAAFMAAAKRASEPVKQELFALAREAAAKQYGLLKTTYPVGPTGNLRDRVYQGQRNEGSFWVKAIAPHVHLYEYGTVPHRLDTTRKNANRGQMPAANVFVGLAVKHRDEFQRQGQAVLDRPHEIG